MKAEQGFLSVAALCLLLLSALLGLALWQLVRCGVSAGQECVQETRLRLAAESCLEEAAQDIERKRLAVRAQPGGAPVCVRTVRAGEAQEITVDIWQVVPAGRETVQLQAWAALERDGAGWERRQHVSGWLRKEGEDHVWCGWLLAAD